MNKTIRQPPPPRYLHHQFSFTCRLTDLSEEKAGLWLVFELLFGLLLRPVSVGCKNPIQEFLGNRLTPPLLRGYSCRVHQSFPLVLHAQHYQTPPSHLYLFSIMQIQ